MPRTNIIGGNYLAGNYWHDYKGIDIDGDGIGDTLLPYNCSGNITNGGDYAPLYNYPPVANFSYVPENPTTADVINFTDLSYDLDGIIVNWAWNFGDGSYSYEQNPLHRYSDDGVYNVTLTVTDDDGAMANITKQIIVGNVPPVANFSYSPENPTDLDIINFTDLSYDLDGNIVSWLWEFGDGSISYEKNPSHQYSHEGNYVVNLTVWMMMAQVIQFQRILRL